MLAWVLWMGCVSPILGSYRQFHVDNADLCNTGQFLKTKTLDLGSGAAILKLQHPSISFQPNYHNKAKRCEIHVRASENFGLMAYVEEMHLRQSTKDSSCVDYIQFGKDDLVPFMTLDKSNRICGERYGRGVKKDGFAYDDPTGNLLIWVSLGGRRQTTSWPQISSVNLTVIITSYQKQCTKPNTGFKRCATRDRCIWKHYFCDKHFNCPADLIPADEDGCNYDAEHSEDSDDDSDDEDTPDDNAVNVITWTLIIVCCSLIILLPIHICLQMRRNRKCCVRSASNSEDPGSNCDLPENQQPRSLMELNRQRHLRQSEANIYLPLTAFVDQTSVQLPPTSSETRLPASDGHFLPDEEPPPAYEELFPRSQENEAHLVSFQTESLDSSHEDIPPVAAAEDQTLDNSQTSLRHHLSEALASNENLPPQTQPESDGQAQSK